VPDPIQGMNITNPVTPATSSGQTVAPASTGTPSATQSAGPPAAVDLADVAQTEALLQSIIQAANNTPGIDQTKVAELQQAIASGSYQTNSQSIAQKIAELEVMLGTAGLVR
jgi:flagellar biosynthesis anti-sigma factor FlgM